MKIPHELLYPTRIEQLSFNYLGITLQLRVKRDDLIHPLINGNKWRKLAAHLLASDLAPGQTIASVGGAYSNHLLAVAALGKMLGLRTYGFVRGDEMRTANPYDHWLQQLNMQLVRLPRAMYRDKHLCYGYIKTNYPDVQLIPEGGHPLPSHQPLAALLDEQAFDYQHLYVSCGTGATLLALAAGLAERQQDHLRLHGVSVEKKPENITELASKTLALHANSKVYHSPSGRHFGHLTPEMLAISKACFEQTGIAPDPIYDALVLLQIYQNHQNGSHQANDKILWLHSGGLPGWVGYPLKCQELFGL